MKHLLDKIDEIFISFCQKTASKTHFPNSNYKCAFTYLLSCIVTQICQDMNDKT